MLYNPLVKSILEQIFPCQVKKQVSEANFSIFRCLSSFICIYIYIYILSYTYLIHCFMCFVPGRLGYDRFTPAKLYIVWVKLLWPGFGGSMVILLWIFLFKALFCWVVPPKASGTTCERLKPTKHARSESGQDVKCTSKTTGANSTYENANGAGDSMHVKEGSQGKQVIMPECCS